MSQVVFPITTFQYSSTQPVANGYMIIHLNKDCAITGNGGQISARIKIRVPLDAGGEVAEVLFWPNVELNPSDSVYVYSVYNKDGQRVLGPLSIIIGLVSGLGFGVAFGSSFGS